MAEKSPENVLIEKKISFSGPLVKNDKVSVKDSTIYRIPKWQFLVKKQTLRNIEKELLLWLDELADEGWQLISSQPSHLGLYIFKRPVK
jgi:hypothetical protein